jgi:hypothetical protein
MCEIQQVVEPFLLVRTSVLHLIIQY